MRKCMEIDLISEEGDAQHHGSGGETPGVAKGKIETALLDQGRQGGNHVQVRDAIMEILEEIDSKLVGRFNQRLEGIPGCDAIGSACLQTHVSFADPLSGTQFSRIVMQENLRMGKHHQ